MYDTSVFMASQPTPPPYKTRVNKPLFCKGNQFLKALTKALFLEGGTLEGVGWPAIMFSSKPSSFLERKATQEIYVEGETFLLGTFVKQEDIAASPMQVGWNNNSQQYSKLGSAEEILI